MARRIFYASLTNLRNSKKPAYITSHFAYIIGYRESEFDAVCLFIIGTKLSNVSYLRDILGEDKHIVLASLF
jgi:hypothetical protein